MLLTRVFDMSENFIFQFQVPEDVCDKLIDYHKNNKDDKKDQNISFALHNSIKRYIDDRTLEPYKQPRISLDPPDIRKRAGCPPQPPVIPANNHTPPHELDEMV